MEFQLFHTTLSASLLLFIMAGGFLAGFVDSIAGGGGLITVPALMLAGLRFMLVAFPALLFVARPAIPLRLCWAMA